MGEALPADYDSSKEFDDEECVNFPPELRRDKDIDKHPVVLVKPTTCKNSVHEKYDINEPMKKRYIPPKDWYFCIHNYQQIKKATKRKHKKWPSRGYKCIAKKECKGEEFDPTERVARCRKCFKPIYGENCLEHYWRLYITDDEDDDDDQKNDNNKNKNKNKNNKNNKNKDKNKNNNKNNKNKDKNKKNNKNRKKKNQQEDDFESDSSINEDN